MIPAGPRLLFVCAAAALNAAAARYADPAVCEKCHPQIAATYRKTGMGRSFVTPARAGHPEDFSAKQYYHAPSDQWFLMTERAGAWLQRRWQAGFGGAETNAEEKTVDYILGSGNHGRTYLHLTARGTLQQLPLGWYAEKNGYFAMNPGYDKPDYPGSFRAIGYNCMFCHNGYPEIPKANEEDGAEPRFTKIPEGIDCQRCHGPGAEHAATAGYAPIVNPAKLSPERALEVCLQCHLEPTSRALPGALKRKGRAPFSYVPGQPLGDFRLAFDRAGGNPDFEVAQAGYRFLRSQCFLRSSGKLLCTTCHNPHDIPRGTAALASYNGVCQNCHQTLPTTHTKAPDCVPCHMPKRRTDDAVHIVMTDHLISRRPPVGALTAEKSETPANAYRGAVLPFYPARLGIGAQDSLDRAIAQVKDSSNLKPGLAQLDALILRLRPQNAAYYAELAEAYRAAGNGPQAIRNYDEALRRAPASVPLLLRLGNMLIDARQFVRAEATFRQATVLAPGDPLAWGLLGWSLWQLNRPGDAVAALERGIALDPELPDLHNYLASVYLGGRDTEAAERHFRAAIALEPGIAEWQANLGNFLAAKGALPEAAWQMEKSLRLKPDDAITHIDYARLLSAGGDAAGALRELWEAVRLQPDSGRAQLELGNALLQAGDRPAAIDHLKRAAQSPDPRAKAAALDLLRRAGQ